MEHCSLLSSMIALYKLLEEGERVGGKEGEGKSAGECDR